MSSTPSSPFDLPGAAGHPMAAGLDMMRAAWQQWAGSGLPAGQLMTPALTLEELDRRINDLRAVEQWLRLHQGMVASSLQGLEMQRVALNTVQACLQASAAPAAETATTGSHAERIATDAAQQWFDMLQRQFNQLAAATGAAPQATAQPAPPTEAAPRAAARKSARKTSHPASQTSRQG